MEIGIGDRREGAIAVNVEVIVSGGGVSRRLFMSDNNATAPGRGCEEISSNYERQ